MRLVEGVVVRCDEAVAGVFTGVDLRHRAHALFRGSTQVDDADPGKARAPVADGNEAAEGLDFLNAHAADIPQHAASLIRGVCRGARGCRWNIDDVEVGSVAVVDDEEAVFPIDHGVFDRIVDVLLTRPHRLRFGGRVRGGDEPGAGRGLRFGRDE